MKECGKGSGGREGQGKDKGRERSIIIHIPMSHNQCTLMSK